MEFSTAYGMDRSQPKISNSMEIPQFSKKVYGIYSRIPFLEEK